MEPFVARAFLSKLLSEGEKKDLKAHEIWLRDRYLTGSEICRRYNLKPEPLPESDISRMDTLLWQWRRTQAGLFDQLRQADGDEAIAFDVNGEQWLADLWAWETYAEANY